MATGIINDNYCIECRTTAAADCELKKHVVGTLRSPCAEVVLVDDFEPAQQATGEQQAARRYIIESTKTNQYWNPAIGWTNHKLKAEFTEAEHLSVALPPNSRWVVIDRGADNLGKLDAHGLAELRSIILTVIDDGDPLHAGAPWELYVSDCIEFDKANFQRLDFASAVEAEIVRRAAPATAGRAK